MPKRVIIHEEILAEIIDERAPRRDSRPTQGDAVVAAVANAHAAVAASSPAVALGFALMGTAQAVAGGAHGAAAMEASAAATRQAATALAVATLYRRVRRTS